MRICKKFLILKNINNLEHFRADIRNIFETRVFFSVQFCYIKWEIISSFSPRDKDVRYLDASIYIKYLTLDFIAAPCAPGNL